MIDTQPTINLILSDIKEDELLNFLESRYSIKKFTTNSSESYLVKSTQSGFDLKAKDIKVLDLLSQGKKYGEIAQEMEMSIDGVRYYTKRIYKKLGVNNARAAISKTHFYVHP